MAHDERDKDVAARYLAGNAALRRALGIADDAELEPRYLGEGEHNRNFRFDDPSSGRSFVLRINVAPQPFHDNQIAYEFAALTLLEPSGRAPRPLYLDDSPDAPGEGALVESFCEGDPLDFDHLRPGDLKCAAQLMADLHAVRVDDVERCPLHRPADPLRGLFDECVARFEAYRVSGCEDARLTRWTERFIAAAQSALNTPTRRVGGAIRDSSWTGSGPSSARSRRIWPTSWPPPPRSGIASSFSQPTRRTESSRSTGAPSTGGSRAGASMRGSARSA